MGKSIYSLVLDDELIRRIDMLANKSGKSRSGIINEILAEKISYDTPERVSKDMITLVNEMLEGSEEFGILLQETSMYLRSVIAYKYNPTVKYSLDVLQDEGICGILRVVVRSRSLPFMELYEAFIVAWCRAELAHKPDTQYSYEGGRFSRVLRPVIKGESIDYSLPAKEIADYISFFDESLKRYFALALDRGKKFADAKTAQIYDEYLKRTGTTI